MAAMSAQNGFDDLLPLVYEELHSLAGRLLERERPDHTLQATALVHEAYMRLREQRNLDLGNRNQFFALAARLIRRILVDHSRRKAASKRDAPPRVSFQDEIIGDAPQSIEVMAISEAL